MYIFIDQFTKFGQLIVRKITKIIATRCQILKLKCTKLQLRALGAHTLRKGMGVGRECQEKDEEGR